MTTTDLPDPPTIADDQGLEPSMLLSRTAENVYWTGRYLERAESTARIIKAHTELYLDLPKAAGLGWQPLLAVTGTRKDFDELYRDTTEENVISFLAADVRNAGSIVASLNQARENMRTARTVFPREAWEALNELRLAAAELSDEAVLRRGRSRWMAMVIGDVQRVSGILNGTMSHDDAYSFLQMGQQLERADMTSRVLDVRVTSLLQVGTDRLTPFADVQWMSILKSLSAHQMYRRMMQNRVNGPDALRFLLQNKRFPRSIAHCLDAFERAAHELPEHDGVLQACHATKELVEGAKARSLAWEGLGEFVDDVQVHFAQLDASLREAYFRTTFAPSTATGAVKVSA